MTPDKQKLPKIWRTTDLLLLLEGLDLAWRRGTWAGLQTASLLNHKVFNDYCSSSKLFELCDAKEVIGKNKIFKKYYYCLY